MSAPPPSNSMMGGDEEGNVNTNSALASSDSISASQSSLARQQRRAELKGTPSSSPLWNTSFIVGDEVVVPKSTQDITETNPLEEDAANPASPQDELVNADQVKQRRKRRTKADVQSKAASASVSHAPEVETQQSRRVGKSRQSTGESALPQAAGPWSVTSPSGEAKVTLDPEDVVDSLRTTSHPHAVTVDIPMANSSSTAAQDSDLLFIEDRRRYRRTTVGKSKTADGNAIGGAGPGSAGLGANASALAKSNTVEARVGRFLRRVNLYELAMAYFCFGIVAGMGMITLCVLPLVPPSPVDTSTTIIGNAAMSNSPLLTFLAFYPSQAATVGNLFNLLSVIMLMYALDMRSAESASRNKMLAVERLSGGKSSAIDDITNHRRMRGRYWVSLALTLTTTITFLSSVGIFGFEDQLWTGATSTSTLSTNVPALTFAKGPFLQELGSPISAADYPQESGTLAWYWYYARTPAAGGTSANPFPVSFTAELQVWGVLNGVRGVAAILSWILALLEMRFRGGHKVVGQERRAQVAGE